MRKQQTIGQTRNKARDMYGVQAGEEKVNYFIYMQFKRIGSLVAGCGNTKRCRKMTSADRNSGSGIRVSFGLGRQVATPQPSIRFCYAGRISYWANISNLALFRFLKH